MGWDKFNINGLVIVLKCGKLKYLFYKGYWKLINVIWNKEINFIWNEILGELGEWFYWYID